MVQGWIKLHRQFTEWEWYTDDKCFRLFIHILLKSNHKDAKWRGETIERGQFITSLGNLASEVGMTVQTLRTTLKKLESTGEINKQSNNKLTKITVCKYDTYQDEEKETNKQTNKQLTNDQQTTNKQLTTNKNDKNENNEKNMPLQEEDSVSQIDFEKEERFEKFWKFYDYKKEKKKAKACFMRLNDNQIKDISAKVGKYKANTFTDGTFPSRMYPARYLNPKSELWKDEIIEIENSSGSGY